MKTLLSILFLFFATYGYSQSEKLFTVDRELSNSNINQIYQAKDGVIWIATEDGLNRYDGAKFSVYKHKEGNDSSLVDNNVRILFEDSKGNFLIGTQRGLQLYDPSTDLFKEIPILYQTGINMSAHISTILERKNGELLIGTSGHAVYSLTLGGTEPLIKEAQLPVPSFFITYLFEDQNENLWVSTEGKGLYRIDTSGQIYHYFIGKENAWNIVTSICLDEKGNIYASNINKGIFVYDQQKDTFIPISCPILPSLPINTIYAAGQGKIYIGTIGYGIKVYDIHTQKIKESEFSFSTFDFSKADVHAITKDRAGNLWLGINGKGVMLLPATTNQFKYMGYKSVTTNKIGSNSIKAVCKDNEGTLWLGTANDGIYGIKGKNKPSLHFEHKETSNSVPSTINHIHQTADGRLWLASPLEGLAEMNPKTGLCRYYKLQDHYQNEVKNISYLTSDKNGERLWVAVMGGGVFYIDLKTGKVNRCDTFESGKEYQENYNVLHNRWVASLLYTSNNKLYIGTYDGLGCLDIPTMNFASTYGKNRIFSGSIILTLFEDEQGDIWAGTTKGLIHIDGKNGSSKTYTTHDGLPNNTICAIQGDKQHGLWISTNYGITNMDPETGTFINYYAGNGLQGNEFSKNAACTDKDGYLIFGGINGITFFRPAEITTEVKKPEVRIADFYIHNKAVKKGTRSGNHEVIETAVQEASRFRLCHRDNSFSIEFSAMEFYNPERITYLYSMNGATWMALAPGVNRVSFSDLAPGTYHFRMKAKDYTAYSEEKEIIIQIDPAWWASGCWAKLIYVLLILSIIGFIVMQVHHRYRMHQKMLQHIHAEQINEAKLQFFINISHEIRTPMSLIISPLQQLMAKDKDAECRKLYSTIQRNAERILQLVNQLMDIRKIDKGQMSLMFKKAEIVSFTRDLLETFEQQTRVKKLDLKFHTSAPEIEMWIDPKNFDKIILNLLSNACKFTPENGQVEISLSTGEDTHLPQNAPLRRYVELTVADSGIGIASTEREHIFERFYQIRNSQNNSNIGTGIGLHLTRSLVELHYGNIHVEDNGEGRPGSRFIIRLPLGNGHLKKEEIEEATTADTLINIPAAEPATIVPPLPYDDDEEASGKVRARSRRHVLVVEDDEEIRHYICRELSNDFYMTECSNGKEALASILSHTPDLIISDVMMPEMDGLTLCRKIRQNVNINYLPIILLTARTSEEDNLEGLDTGADAYLMKPFSIELLRKTVLNLIRRREQLRNAFSGRQNQEEQISIPEVKSPDDRLMERVMRVINENLGNPALTVEMISTEVGISRVHLHRKLKELTNQTTQQLIRNLRLKQAATLLADKRHSITEVATLTGFTHPTYFATAFREMYGISPSEYMERHIGQDKTKDLF